MQAAVKFIHDLTVISITQEIQGKMYRLVEFIIVEVQSLSSLIKDNSCIIAVLRCYSWQTKPL